MSLAQLMAHRATVMTRTQRKDAFGQAIESDLAAKLVNVPCRLIRTFGKTTSDLQMDRTVVNHVKVLFPSNLGVQLSPEKDIITAVNGPDGNLIASAMRITFVNPVVGRDGRIHHIEVEGSEFA